MGTNETLSSLSLFTMIAVFAVVLVSFLWFRRKRSNRHPMENVRERNIDEIRDGDPPRPE